MEITLELTAEQGDSEITLECELQVEETLDLLDELEVNTADVSFFRNFIKTYVDREYPDDDMIKTRLGGYNANSTDATNSEANKPLEEATGSISKGE